MGHYDVCYNADRDRHEQVLRERDIRLMTKLDPLFEQIESAMRHEISNDHPFKTCLYDFQKEYIAWQYERGLVIRDPKILIDILKDDD